MKNFFKSGVYCGLMLTSTYARADWNEIKVISTPTLQASCDMDRKTLEAQAIENLKKIANDTPGCSNSSVLRSFSQAHLQPITGDCLYISYSARGSFVCEGAGTWLIGTGSWWNSTSTSVESAKSQAKIDAETYCRWHYVQREGSWTIYYNNDRSLVFAKAKFTCFPY